MMNEISYEATITCPKCGYSHRETMPSDRCQIFYACKRCGHTMSPKQGDCCVFCSYADKPCPPKQSES